MAMEPLYGARPVWVRCGLGFGVGEAGGGGGRVYSEVGKGTRVKLSKHIGDRT